MVTKIDSKKLIAPGARVEVRGEEWIVKKVNAIQGGHSYKVIGVSELVRNHEAIFLDTLDEVIEIRPEDTEFVFDDTEKYRKSRLYIEALLRKTPPIDNKLYTGYRGAFDLSEFQLKPASMALENLRPRVLIADAVGLGKTIEVGILLSELIKRGRGDRILVVTMKSMLSQFQQEMWARFTIPLVRLDSVGLQKVRSKIPSNKNPFNFYNKAIISVDTLKNDSQYRTFLEQSHWDAIVIDECHNVANANTQRNRLASLLARTCDSLILTSATPHNGKPQSFAQLINMIEPTAIADEEDYTHEEIEGLFTRRFKKDIEHEVGDQFSDRQLHVESMKATREEERLLKYIHSLRFNTLDGKKSKQLSIPGLTGIRGTKDTLFKNTLFKAFLSSPAACLHTVQQRINKLEKRMEEEPQTEEVLGEDLNKLQHAEDLVLRITDETFSKFDKFKSLLKELKWNGKKNSPRIILFSERIQTLEFLSEKIREEFNVDEDVVRVFHAGLSDVEQQEVVESFGKENAPVRLLLATDVASEGVNLHYYCNHLVHFDIPWSLITLEQRNGRIDRYGQHKTPHIYYLLTKSDDDEIKGDFRILDKLIEKENEAHKNLGDSATIMNLFDPEKEEEHIEKELAEGKSPDEILPSLDDLDMDKMLSEMDQMLNKAETPKSEEYKKSTPYQWMDDYAFMKQSLQVVLDEGINQRDQIEFLEDNESIVWFAPDDVKHVLTHMPNEAVPKNKEFHFTTNRDSIQKAISEARKNQGKWPDKQLLWEQHPLFAYLIERVIVKYDKNEAPIIQLPTIKRNQVIYFIQGVLFNKRAQPVISQWFGIEVNGVSQEESKVHTFDELEEKLGISSEIYNPGEFEYDVSLLHDEKINAINTAKEYLSKLREQRGKSLMQDITDDLRKLKKWRDKKVEIIEKEEREKSARGTIPKHIAAKLEHERKTVEELYKNRREWINKTMATDERPFLRIAAVFVGK
ncbi:helicase-related protein [Aquibacillus albus]|uniref:Superfamily II DNA or RNA helicase n=1 Tax=Aquibacillus albus TaxID=1168171 RepID=A0ABS2N4A6_9BACI|nr:helicase-related protein [Aquibacillus albus]MBM7572941.1 superfamily II DNA or RNA helicase [Aquibacillus albus]